MPTKHNCNYRTGEERNHKRDNIFWETSGEGIEQHNAQQAFSVFSKAEGVKYIRDGYLYPSIDFASNQYASWFKNSDAVKRKVSCDLVIMMCLIKTQ